MSPMHSGMVAMGKYIHNDLPITMFACNRNEYELNPIKMDKKLLIIPESIYESLHFLIIIFK